MAVSVTTNKNRLTSNGSTTAFNFTFPLPDSDTTQVKVMLTVGSVDTLQDVSLYSVTATNNAFSSGGTVTFTTAPASSTTFWGVALGDVLDIGTPSDKSVTSAKLATTSFSFFIS